MVKDKRIVDFLSVALVSFASMDLASSQNGSVLWLWGGFLFAWLFPVILFLSSCKQPLEAWCTLRNNFEQKILTRHWKLTVRPLSPSFRAKWGVTPNGLITQDVWKSTSRHWCAVSDWKCYIAIPRYCEHSCLWFLQMLCLKYSC